jgi:transcriptional regulator with XRE-family HTH domain
MYNIYGIGKRIGIHRKLKGLTQEELAAKLNITAQAVSKWENELSFPEITILPFLAKELNTSIEKLFGNEEVAKAEVEKKFYSPSFPGIMDGNSRLRLVHSIQEVACYSEKEVEVTNEDTVVFKDGSMANLKQKKILNKGSGDIVFSFMDASAISYGDIDMSKTEFEEEFYEIYSVEAMINNAEFKLMRSNGNKTIVKAKGSPVFINSLKTIKTDEMLALKFNNQNDGGGSGSSNSIIIELGCDLGKIIGVNINGSGDVDLKVPFQEGKFSINGSGDIKIHSIDKIHARINGSGDIKCGKVGNAEVMINGSGDFSADEVTGAFKAAINGSGDITLKSGNLDSLELNIKGSGDIDAEDIITKTAKLAVEGSSGIVIGWIKEESIEKHSKNSSIKVIKRGIE